MADQCRGAALLCLALVAGTSVLAGQRRRYEAGAFAAYTRYHESFGLEGAFGGGARFGYLFGNHLELQAEVLFQAQQVVPGTTSVTEPIMGGGSLVLNVGGERSLLYVLAGYSRLDFGAVNPYRFTDGAVHAAVGDRLFLSHRVALRVEARAIYTPETNAPFGSKTATHFVGSIGFSMFDLGGAPSVDSDGDGVFDKRDACPATPAGAGVDRRGCPSDEDQDGVYNGIDTCPATPRGALVDGVGCPKDTDADKVVDGLDNCPDTPPGATVDGTGCPLDADGDRVPDGIDQCPNTPTGAGVDANGCPIDSDKDAVWDGIDQCPNTPVGATVDATGCPSDADQDTVFDGIDKCPSTPPGTKVGADGCPLPVDLIRDTDRDGVVDQSDRCPGTPVGNRVDSLGCVMLFRPEAPRTPLVLRGVQFETGRSALRPASYAVLEIVAGSLVANPEIRIEIAGHTDNTGSAALNQRLSQARAEAVRAYLALKGVSPDRMVARGYGPSRPVASNVTPAGRARNRRVELLQQQ